MGQRTLAAEWGQGRGCVFEREKKAGRATERWEIKRERERIEFDKETRLWEPLYPVSLSQLISSLLLLLVPLFVRINWSRFLPFEANFLAFLFSVILRSRLRGELPNFDSGSVNRLRRGSADASRRMHTARCIFRSRVINSVQRGLTRLLSRRRPPTRGITES